MTLFKFPTSIIRRARLHGFKALTGNEEGVSAIEFALVAPFLLLLYFGSVEISLLLQSDRRVTSTSATMGDLASRFTIIDDNDRDNIFAAATAVLGATSASEARLRLTSIVNMSGTVTVVWSDATSNFTPLMPGQTLTSIPAGIIPDGDTVLMAETQFDYTGLGLFLTGTRTLEDRFFLRPRRTDAVDRIP